MPKFEDLYFNSSNGANIVRARKCCPDGEARAVLQISHGIAEHIGRYEDFMLFLAENGIVSVGDDHLGHGKTYLDNKDKGFFAEKDGWNCVVDDMHQLYELMKADYPSVPYILFGHSMGSFLTRTYMIRYPDDYDLSILSGTGHQDKALIYSGALMADALCKVQGSTAIGDALNKVAFGSYLDRIDNPRTEFDWLSRDTNTVDRYIADENCGFVAKNGLYRDMMQGLKFLTNPANIDRMNKSKPVYFMSGEEDPVGDYGKGVRRAYKAFCDALFQDVTIRLYPGGRHEMLNELNRDDVYQDILSWIDSRIKTE